MNVEEIAPENLSIEHMHGQITIRYIGADQKVYEQSGLGLCLSGKKLTTNREKDSVFFELTFECVTLVHPIKEIVE